jgi:glycerol-3-phosphate acyltransferase PlsX
MSDLNFIGNVEGKDIPKGVADVVVCDGFTGNVVTKVTEGLSEMLFESLRQALTRQLHFKVAASILRPAFSDVKKQLDYTEYGGAPLLGVDGVVIVAHGRSDAKAIKNALRVAKQAVEQNMLAALKLKVAN